MLVPLLPLLVLLGGSTGAAGWDYTTNGDDWSDLGLCAGKGIASAQSPINLPQSAPAFLEKRAFFKYPHLGQSLPVYNDGYSIAFTLPDDYKGGFGFVRDPTLLLGEDS